MLAIPNVLLNYALKMKHLEKDLMYLELGNILFTR